MVQVENEYGSYACDVEYKRWLQDEIYGYVGSKAVLFTADGPSLVKCGQFQNVLATINFGVGKKTNNVYRFLIKKKNYKKN